MTCQECQRRHVQLAAAKRELASVARKAARFRDRPPQNYLDGIEENRKSVSWAKQALDEHLNECEVGAA